MSVRVSVSHTEIAQIWFSAQMQRCKNRGWRAGMHPVVNADWALAAKISEVLSEAWQSISHAGPLRCLSSLPD